MRPIVRNIQNNVLYEYLGENKFKNVNTEKEGIVSDEKAKDIFRFNVDATTIINAYPAVEELIKALNLKVDGLSCVSK